MELDFKTRIPQNSRTIIFDCFNTDESAPNLCKLLAGQEDADALAKINKDLCVYSFEQFKKIFKPTVYEIFGKDENGELAVSYSLDNVKGAHPILLCEHEFYRAVHDIALEKSASKVNNNGIDYTKLYESLDPKRIYDRARNKRALVNQFVENALEEKSKGNIDGAKKWMNEAKKEHAAVIEEYKGNALRLLPLAVRDIELILEGRGVKKEKQESLDPAVTLEKLPCSVGWDDEGNLVTKTLDVSKPEVIAIEDKKQQAQQIARDNWVKALDTLPEDTVNRNIFLSVYSSVENTALMERSTEELQAQKNYLGNCYVAAQQSFCNAIGYLVQKVASVEQFFIHASNDEGIVESGVIIANNTVADILEDKNKIAVKKYLSNAKNNENDRVWFAILPAAVDREKNWVESTVTNNDFDIFNMDFSSAEDEQEQSGINTVTVADINTISELLAEVDILSFFNFNACEATSFKNFGSDTKIIEQYNKELTAIKRPDSLVLAYPNFTIIPKNKRQVETINDTKLYTPAVYIDAAYVAAGIVVSTQNEKIQKSKFGKRVANGYPFMRFDLENKEFSKAFYAKFNPESRLNMDKEMINAICGNEGNAFCFRSDSQANNAFVLTARTLNRKPIYWFITQKYFSFMLSRISSVENITSQQFVNEVSNIVTNKMDESDVNKLLRSGEKFAYNEEKKSFTLQFNGIDEPLNFEVEIVDNNV